ncbi:MAG: TerC family protein [Ferruginibacter sp.]|nr:TerC family protein [Ferruginibacter sp.]
MSELFSSASIISFFVLVLLEIVLGIDNVIFVSIIIDRLPHAKEKAARRVWMITGIIIRSILLMGLGWLLAQKGKTIFSLGNKNFDIASIVMLIGGIFLMYKTVREIHHKLEGEDDTLGGANKPPLSFSKAVLQIMLIDTVFSFDSIITAGGTAEHVEIMIAAVVLAMIIMFLFSPKISAFIHKHPSLKMLALSFLVMIGLTLVVEGWDSEKAHELHLKNYVYFGMAFSFLVEVLNINLVRKEKKRRIVRLNEPVLEEEEEKTSDSAH